MTLVPPPIFTTDRGGIPRVAWANVWYNQRLPVQAHATRNNPLPYLGLAACSWAGLFGEPNESSSHIGLVGNIEFADGNQANAAVAHGFTWDFCFNSQIPARGIDRHPQQRFSPVWSTALSICTATGRVGV